MLWWHKKENNWMCLESHSKFATKILWLVIIGQAIVRPIMRTEGSTLYVLSSLINFFNIRKAKEMTYLLLNQCMDFLVSKKVINGACVLSDIKRQWTPVKHPKYYCNQLILKHYRLLPRKNWWENLMKIREFIKSFDLKCLNSK